MAAVLHDIVIFHVICIDDRKYVMIPALHRQLVKNADYMEGGGAPRSDVIISRCDGRQPRCGQVWKNLLPAQQVLRAWHAPLILNCCHAHSLPRIMPTFLNTTVGTLGELHLIMCVHVLVNDCLTKIPFPPSSYL